jgi:hypothetical protein
MKPSKILIIAGAAITLAAAFLPFRQFPDFGIGVKLSGVGLGSGNLIQAGGGNFFIVFAGIVATCIFGMMGKAQNKNFPIVALSCSAVVLLLTVYWLLQMIDGSITIIFVPLPVKVGIGAYILPVGVLLAAIGSYVAMKEPEQ